MLGARVDVEDKQKNTALHIAARHGHASVTKTLACNGANLMRKGAGGMLPVHMACLSGYSDCVETLIPISKWVGLSGNWAWLNNRRLPPPFSLSFPLPPPQVKIFLPKWTVITAPVSMPLLVGGKDNRTDDGGGDSDVASGGGGNGGGNGGGGNGGGNSDIIAFAGDDGSVGWLVVMVVVVGWF